MTVDILFESGDKRHFPEVDKVVYHEGFIEIIKTYYDSEIFPSRDVKKIDKESRRSF